MKYLLDTDTCAYWLRGQVAVQRQLAAMDPADLAVSIVTLAELYCGASWSAQPTANKTAIDDFVDKINVLSLNAAIVQSFGEAKAQLRKQGQLIEDFDLLIAMTARVLDITLVTNNERHFRRVPGVQLINWLNV